MATVVAGTGSAGPEDEPMNENSEEAVPMTDAITSPHGTDLTIIVEQLHARLKHATSRLGDYVKAHGMLCDRDDEVFAFAGVALGMATESGLINADGSFSERFAIVPVDDEFRQIADPVLPNEMIEAGMKVCDLMHADHMADAEDERAGRDRDPERADWDDGMLCVGIYRAMVRQARSRPHHCRLETSDRDDWTVVSGTSHKDAARVFAVETFRSSEGEWMGGKVKVAEDPFLAILFGEDFDVTIGFDETENRDLRAVAVRCGRDAPVAG